MAKKLLIYLANSARFCIFAMRQLPNISPLCGLKSTYYKLMPGSTFVGLVTVASSQQASAPGSLVFFLPVFSYL